MQTPQNREKGERFGSLLETYRQRYDAGEDYGVTLTDMLVDARHWCDTIGIDFEFWSERTELHYMAEAAGEE